MFIVFVNKTTCFPDPATHIGRFKCWNLPIFSTHITVSWHRHAVRRLLGKQPSEVRYRHFIVCNGTLEVGYSVRSGVNADLLLYR